MSKPTLDQQHRPHQGPKGPRVGSAITLEPTQTSTTNPECPHTPIYGISEGDKKIRLSPNRP